MSARNIFGLMLLLAGVVLQPVGWMYTHWVTAVSFAAIVAGVLMLYVERRHEGGKRRGAAPASSRPRHAGRCARSQRAVFRRPVNGLGIESFL
jgi:hypothetical protein